MVLYGTKTLIMLAFFLFPEHRHRVKKRGDSARSVCDSKDS